MLFSTLPLAEGKVEAAFEIKETFVKEVLSSFVGRTKVTQIR